MEPEDAAGFALGALATIAILFNVLFMQSGSHPLPMFKDALVAAGNLVKRRASLRREAGGSDGQHRLWSRVRGRIRRPASTPSKVTAPSGLADAR